MKDKIIIDPYVTTQGGVVILNGPFDIDQAHRVARLCKAAPDLLEILKEVDVRMNRYGSGDVTFHSRIMAAIAKAEGQE